MVAAWTGEPGAILDFPRLWLLGPGGGEPVPVQGLAGKTTPKGLIVHLKGCTTRAAADALRGWELAVDRADLPQAGPDEFYQADLLGLRAVSGSGLELGVVERLMDNGSALVLVVVDPSGRERLIPFTDECVPEVDLAAGLMTVAEMPGLLD
jgi:16S rRNA processing protein RimM